MFMMSVKYMMSEEQQAKWLPLTMKHRIIGTYAQTELGHGSDVSGVETTATFDKEADQFVINTPTHTAIKWWPGDLGMHSTHAVTYCKVIIFGKSYGVLPLLIQIRDTQTFMPMKGVELGDMGPKFGFNSKNNGWCSFNNVRIPREQLFGKFVNVDRQGKLTNKGNAKALYAVLMGMRTLLVFASAYYLGKALIISGRYSVVRRQFRNTNGS